MSNVAWCNCALHVSNFWFSLYSMYIADFVISYKFYQIRVHCIHMHIICSWNYIVHIYSTWFPSHMEFTELSSSFRTCIHNMYMCIQDFHVCMLFGNHIHIRKLSQLRYTYKFVTWLYLCTLACTRCRHHTWSARPHAHRLHQLGAPLSWKA